MFLELLCLKDPLNCTCLREIIASLLVLGFKKEKFLLKGSQLGAFCP